MQWGRTPAQGVVVEMLSIAPAFSNRNNKSPLMNSNTTMDTTQVLFGTSLRGSLTSSILTGYNSKETVSMSRTLSRSFDHLKLMSMWRSLNVLSSSLTISKTTPRLAAMQSFVSEFLWEKIFYLKISLNWLNLHQPRIRTPGFLTRLWNYYYSWYLSSFVQAFHNSSLTNIGKLLVKLFLHNFLSVLANLLPSHVLVFVEKSIKDLRVLGVMVSASIMSARGYISCR